MLPPNINLNACGRLRIIPINLRAWFSTRVCQDEKLMVVLKKTKSDWRLFWVVELVGISFTLALAAIKCGGDPEATMVKSTQPSESHDESTFDLIVRPVFGWRFLLFHSPVAVTSLSMVVRAIAMHLVDVFDNGNGRNDFKSFLCAMKQRCTAYRGVIAALVLLEIGPFMAAVYISPHASHDDSYALQVVKCIKAAGAVTIGSFCTFYGRLPAASSETSAEWFRTSLYKVAFLGLLVLYPISLVNSVWFELWDPFTVTVLLHCFSVIVYGFWCHRNWNVFPESCGIAPKQRPRWQIMFVLVWLLFECYLSSRPDLLRYGIQALSLGFISASVYVVMGISVAFECVRHPCFAESPRPSSKTFSLLLAWSIYRLTSWDVLNFLNNAYFRESYLELEFEQLLRSATLHIVFLCLGINAQARALRNESVQFCLLVIFLFHVVVVWFYTLVSDLRFGTIK